jgi:hypothetical protein
MNIKQQSLNIYRHYFTEHQPQTKSLLEIARIPISIVFIFAFLTIGFDSQPVFNLKLPLLFMTLGFVSTGLIILLHMLLFATGTVHKYGVIKPSKKLGFLLIGSIMYLLFAGITLYGGILVSAFIFIIALPTNTPLISLNIIGFIIGSLWWYSKGLKFLTGAYTFKELFRIEREECNRLYNKYV